MPRNPNIPCICLTCGQPFMTYPAYIRKGGGKYCSRACWRTGKTSPVADRFWPKVRKTETCRLWTGALNPAGYGMLGSGGKFGRPYTAHRVSWEIHNGAIPDGYFVCHRCDNPPCVRPDHLFMGSPLDNMRDMIAKGRQVRGEQHPHAVLTNAQAAEIRARYAAGGISQTALACEYGVRQQTIQRIVRQGRYAAV